jgi:hypothetical protein
MFIMEVLFMLCYWEPHEDYQKKLLLCLILYDITEKSRVVSMDKSLSKLYLLDLDNLLPVIKHFYSDTGRPTTNQQGIIRSLVLMLDCNEHSITKWARRVACGRLLCVACGFEFGKAPSFSSYYDFIDRIWLASKLEHIKRKLKPKSAYSKPRMKLKAGQKLPPKHTGVVTKLASLAERGKLREERPEKIFQEFLARCIVDKSAKMGILGDTLFSTTASDSPYDLPIYLRIAQAQRHDSILTIFALNEVRKLYPQITFKNFLADGAMDNYATYRLLHKWDMNPFIPLDSNARIDYHGIEKPCSCSNSSYGRTIYIKPDYDLRLFPPVPRNTDTFKKKFKTRTSVERSNKRILVDYNIEAGKCRSSKHRFARATFAAANIHLDAWVRHTGFSIIDLLDTNSSIVA